MINQKGRMGKLIIEALSLNYGKLFGFQEYLLNLLKFFKENRSEIKAEEVVIVCKDIDQPVFDIFYPEMKIVSFHIKCRLHRYLILNTLRLRLSLKDNDVILFTNNYSALTRQCKHLLVIHDLLYLRKNYAPNNFFCWQRAMFVPRSVKIADSIISISHWVKEDIIKNYHVNPEKIVPIYNYFDFSRFDRDDPSESIKELCNGIEYFLVVCSNAKHKNTITVLRAFYEYRKRGGNKSLLVLGRFTSDLFTYISSLPDDISNNIFNINNISNDDLGYVYRHAFCYISASLFEGLGMPIVEAMYFGMTCIVSDIPVIREVTDGMATYFPPMDVQTLSLCMLKATSNKVRGREQTNVILNKYSKKNTSAQYIRLINSLLS